MTDEEFEGHMEALHEFCRAELYAQMDPNPKNLVIINELFKEYCEKHNLEHGTAETVRSEVYWNTMTPVL